jgi:hypothetical protein
MLSPSQLQALKSRVSNKPIWLNDEIKEGEKTIVKEFFLKKLQGRFFVGFDEYDSRYEEVVALHRKYLRSDFEDLATAVEFVVQNTPITIEDLLRG